MKIHSRISLFSISVTLLLALYLPSQSFGGVSATFHPSDTFDSILPYYNTAETYYSYNTGPIVSNEQYSHANSIEINHGTGSIRGYSGYSLDTARAVTRTGNLISAVAGSNEAAYVANVTGSIMYGTTVNGPEVFGNPAYGTVYIDVEGSFNYDLGAPLLSIGGALGLSISPGGNDLNSTTYFYGSGYTNAEDMTMTPNPYSIYADDALQVFLPTGEILYDPVLPDIYTEVRYLNQDPDDLRMRVALSVPIQNGDEWLLSGTVSGLATHAYLEDFSQVEVGDTGEVDAASGYVDFLNTVTIGIELPEGFTLEGDNAPPQSIISYVNPVPIPGAAWLLGSGLLGIVRLRKEFKK